MHKYAFQNMQEYAVKYTNKKYAICMYACMYV